MSSLSRSRQEAPHLLIIPPELRLQIYDYLFYFDDPQVGQDLSILEVCRSIRAEARERLTKFLPRTIADFQRELYLLDRNLAHLASQPFESGCWSLWQAMLNKSSNDSRRITCSRQMELRKSCISKILPYVPDYRGDQQPYAPLKEEAAWDIIERLPPRLSQKLNTWLKVFALLLFLAFVVLLCPSMGLEIGFKGGVWPVYVAFWWQREPEEKCDCFPGTPIWIFMLSIYFLSSCITDLGLYLVGKII